MGINKCLPNYAIFNWGNLVYRCSKFPAITVEIPAFLFAITHEVTFFPHFLLNLSCGGFFLWGNYSHFFSFAQCPMHSFYNASAQKSWEVLKMCVSIAYQKETEPEECYFCRLGRGGDANISYYYSMNTLGLCFEQGGTKTLERQFSGNMGNSNFRISPCMGWRLMDTNLRKLPSRIKFFKTWQVWVYLIQNWTKSITNIIFIFSDCFLQTT